MGLTWEAPCGGCILVFLHERDGASGAVTPPAERFQKNTLTNVNGLKARVSNYGAMLVAMQVPDRDGKLADITLGYDTLEGYIEDTAYLGATIGRYANRIGKAKFGLNGVVYKLAENDGENHLHGGIRGFNKVVWEAVEVETEDEVGVKLTYLCKDAEEGYPGNLACTIIYTLTKNDELKISYEAQTDKTTVINLTHHSYFNLAGQGTCDILGHERLFFLGGWVGFILVRYGGRIPER